MAPSLLPRGAVCAGLLGVSLVAASPATAATEPSACVLRLVPADAPSPWRLAVAAATRRLATLPSAHDCRTVEIAVRPDGSATLLFLTTDGRGAERALGGPNELAPTLEALLVTLPPAAPEAPTDPAPAAPAKAEPSPASAVAPAPSSSPPLRLSLGLTAGPRFALGAASHVAPSFTLRPTLEVGGWEAALFAEANPVHAAVHGVAFDASLWSYATGLSLGRRERIARWQVGYGVTLGVAVASESASEIPEVQGARSFDVTLPRAGGYARAIYPADAPVRLTLDVAGDAMIGELRDATTAKRYLPPFARYGAASAIGVEVSFR